MAYTKTLIGDVREHGFTDYDSEKLQGVVETINTNFTSIEQTITNIEVEGTADAVGAMVTGNTETGITVSYQDSDNTLDFEVAYGAEAPGDVGTGTAAVGVANAAPRADHNHNLAAHDQETPGDLGLPVPDPAYSGVLTGITVSSTLAQLLAAIDSHTHT